MSFGEVVTGLIAVALLIYLVYALLRPEKGLATMFFVADG